MLCVKKMRVLFVLNYLRLSPYAYWRIPMNLFLVDLMKSICVCLWIGFRFMIVCTNEDLLLSVVAYVLGLGTNDYMHVLTNTDA